MQVRLFSIDYNNFKLILAFCSKLWIFPQNAQLGETGHFLYKQHQLKSTAQHRVTFWNRVNPVALDPGMAQLIWTRTGPLGASPMRRRFSSRSRSRWRSTRCRKPDRSTWMTRQSSEPRRRATRTTPGTTSLELRRNPIGKGWYLVESWMSKERVFAATAILSEMRKKRSSASAPTQKSTTTRVPARSTGGSPSIGNGRPLLMKLRYRHQAIIQKTQVRVGFFA